MLLAFSFGVSADDKNNLSTNIKSPNIPPKSASTLKLDLKNTSLLDGTLLTNLTAAFKPELGNITLPQSETMANSMANEPTNIIVLQNVSLNIILIQNLTEITNTIIPPSMNNVTKNMTKAAI
jgi:hypothetical protein